jgi:CBS domain-containing protein
MKKVKDFMNSKVVSFKPDDSIFDAAQTFAKMGISGAPVVNKDRIIGVVSETDIVKFMSVKLAHFMDASIKPTQSLTMLCLYVIKAGKCQVDIRKNIEKLYKTRVKDVMSKDALTVDPDMNVFEAAALMEKHDINRLPVVVKGRLVGIIARADLIKALVD